MDKCKGCSVEYDPLNNSCAYCTGNPKNQELSDNFISKYTSLQPLDYTISSIDLDPEGHWIWYLEPTSFDDHFNLVITADGIILKTVVQIEDGRWSAEKYKSISKKLKLPFNRLNVDVKEFIY